MDEIRTSVKGYAFTADELHYRSEYAMKEIQWTYVVVWMVSPVRVFGGHLFSAEKNEGSSVLSPEGGG